MLKSKAVANTQRFEVSPIPRHYFARKPTELGLSQQNQFLKRARSQNWAATLWLAGKKLIYETQTLPPERFLDLHLYLKLNQAGDEKMLRKHLKNQRSSLVFLLISMPNRGVYAFKSRLLKITTGCMKLTLPQRVLYLQRRKTQRYRPPAAYSIEVSFIHPKHERKRARYPIGDISEGGMSFFISDTDKAFFKKGQWIREGCLFLRQQRIPFEGRVVNCQKTRSKGRIPRYRVGLEFDSIEKEDQDFLGMYVLEHTIQYG